MTAKAVLQPSEARTFVNIRRTVITNPFLDARDGLGFMRTGNPRERSLSLQTLFGRSNLPFLHSLYSNREATTSIRWLEGQVSAETFHQRAGNVESETGGIGIALEGSKQNLRIRDSRAAIFKANHDRALLVHRADPDSPHFRSFQCSPAVLHQVEEDLDESVVICPYRTGPVCGFPLEFDLRIAADRFYQNPQFIQYRCQVHFLAVVFRISRGQFHGGELFQTEDQRAQC